MEELIEKEYKLKRTGNMTIRINGVLLGRVYDYPDMVFEFSIYQAKNHKFYFQSIESVLEDDDLYKVESFKNLYELYSFIDKEFEEYKNFIVKLEKETNENIQKIIYKNLFKLTRQMKYRYYMVI